MIQTESSTIFSPIRGRCQTLASTSEPVVTPVMISRYFLKNVLPDLGYVMYATLSPGIDIPSKKVGTPEDKN